MSTLAEQLKKDQAQKQIDIMRESIISISVGMLDVKLAEDMEEEDRLSVYKFCHFMHNSPWWSSLIAEIDTSQKEFTVMQASNYEEVLFGRGTINGALLLKELVKKFSDKFEELSIEDKETIDEKDPDRYKMFNSAAQ